MVDKQLLFSENQDLGAASTAAASTNKVKVAGRDIGVGKPLFIVLHVTEEFDDSGDDTTVAVTLRQDDDSAFGSPSVLQTIFTIPAVAPVGTKLTYAIPPGLITEDWIDLNYTFANGDPSAGMVTAYVTDHLEENSQYPTLITSI